MSVCLFRNTNITDLTEGLECYFCFCSATICPELVVTVMGATSFMLVTIVLLETIRYYSRPTNVLNGIEWSYKRMYGLGMASVRGTKEDSFIRLLVADRVGLLLAGLAPGLCGAMSRGFVLVVMTPLWLPINLEIDKTIYKCFVAIPFR